MKPLLDFLFACITPTATAFGIWLVHRLVSILEKKLNFTLDSAAEASLDRYVEQAIAYAEEQAHRADDAKPLSSSSKLQFAVTYVLGALARSGLEGILAEEIEKLVEAKLGMARH